MLRKLYQFYGIKNIDEYVKHEEVDTGSESDNSTSGSGDQNHKAAVKGTELDETKRKKPNGDEGNLPVHNTKNSCMKPEETKKLSKNSEEISDGKCHAGINGKGDFEMTSSTPIHESAPMSQPAVSPITSPPAKRLRTRTRKASFTPLAVRRTRRKC